MGDFLKPRSVGIDWATQDRLKKQTKPKKSGFTFPSFLGRFFGIIYSSISTYHLRSPYKGVFISVYEACRPRLVGLLHVGADVRAGCVRLLGFHLPMRSAGNEDSIFKTDGKRGE